MSPPTPRFVQYIANFVAKKLEKDATAELGALAGSSLGLVAGGSWGVSSAYTNEEGWIWRPFVGTVTGYSAGFLAGLYWPQSVAVIVCTDMYLSKKGIRYSHW